MGDARRSRAELVAELKELRRRIATLTDPSRGEPRDGVSARSKSEVLLHHITQHATDIIAEVDEEGRLLFISPNTEAILGHRPEGLLGRPALDPAVLKHLHPEDRDGVEAERGEAARRGPEPIVYRYRRADGSWCWLETRWRPFRSGDGGLRALMTTRDVTEHHLTLERLRQSEERYRVLFETTFDLVAEVDAEGRVLFASPRVEEVLGYKAEELVGTTPFNLLHPDDVERLADLFLARLTGTHRPRHEQVFRVRHRDGSWRWVQGGGINFETANGETHIVAVMRDVTEQRRDAEERQKLEEWVQQSQKLESLGMMAAGVAHDFNNLLTPILGDASLALMDLPSDSGVRPRLERIQRAAHHAASLTNQLLDYAGIGSLDAEPVDLSKLVQEMGELLRGSVSKRTVLVYDLAADVPSVRADPRLLSQVFVNLLTNASEAVEARLEGGGRIAVRSGAIEADRTRLSKLILGDDLPEGRYVYFEVQDDGSGMDAETRARIFDPFFTTKFTGRGLGLAAVLGIVRKHRGAIEIESEPGRGSRVRVLCPQAGDPGPHPARGQESPGSWQASGTVLVADDDEGAREIVSETLSRGGLDVLSAADGREAIDSFRAHRDLIRLVILDRTMPGASGEEALDEIRRIRGDVPVILVSGYSRESANDSLLGRAGCTFLQKPFLPETLLEKVTELLRP